MAPMGLITCDFGALDIAADGCSSSVENVDSAASYGKRTFFLTLISVDFVSIKVYGLANACFTTRKRPGVTAHAQRDTSSENEPDTRRPRGLAREKTLFLGATTSCCNGVGHAPANGRFPPTRLQPQASLRHLSSCFSSSRAGLSTSSPTGR